MKTKMFHLLHLFVSSLFVAVHSLYVVVRSLTLFVVVYSLYLLDVRCSWYEISLFAVPVVLNRDENELVDRQILPNVVVAVVVVVESLPLTA